MSKHPMSTLSFRLTNFWKFFSVDTGGHYATSRKVASSSPDEVDFFFFQIYVKALN
jgi:hypothetical protein